MTTTKFKKHMEVEAEQYADDTCVLLKAEIMKKIWANKKATDLQKYMLTRDYMKNRVTNEGVIEHLKQLNK